MFDMTQRDLMGPAEAEEESDEASGFARNLFPTLAPKRDSADRSRTDTYYAT